MQLKLRGDGSRYMEWDFSALSLLLFYIGTTIEFTLPKTHLANLMEKEIVQVQSMRKGETL